MKAGLDGLAASLIAYWRESFSLRKVNDGSSASTYKLVTGECETLPKLNEVLDGEHYLIFVNRTFWQNCQSCKMHAQGKINTRVRTINRKVA